MSITDFDKTLVWYGTRENIWHIFFYRLSTVLKGWKQALKLEIQNIFSWISQKQFDVGKSLKSKIMYFKTMNLAM